MICEESVLSKGAQTTHNKDIKTKKEIQKGTVFIVKECVLNTAEQSIAQQSEKSSHCLLLAFSLCSH